MFKFGGDEVEIGDSLVQKWSGACQNYSPRETEGCVRAVPGPELQRLRNHG